MKKFKNFSLNTFLKVLSQKAPTPGGGAVAALCAANAVALLGMVANYSLGRQKCRRVEARLKKVLSRSNAARVRLLDLMDLDAKAYQQVVAARQKPAAQKRKAKRTAAAVPQEVSKLCRQALDMAAVLVKDGNPNLLSDVEVAVEMLFAAYKSAMVMVRINQ